VAQAVTRALAAPRGRREQAERAAMGDLMRQLRGRVPAADVRLAVARAIGTETGEAQ
jgi:hypothetical protein